MRFNKKLRYEPYQFTERKRQAFARKQRNEQERFPLLAGQIAEEQHSVDEEERFRIERMRSCDARMRKLQADTWRKVRAMYFALSETDRAVIRDRWMKWSGPAEPSALSYLIRVHTGEYAAISAASRAESAAIRAQLQLPHQNPLQL